MLARTTILSLCIIPLLVGSCAIKTSQIAIGQNTSLERQLMGEVEPFTEEEMLVASVRGPDGVKVGSRDDLQSRALAARRRQLFNRDDMDELKAAGCLGETLEAELVTRPCSHSSGDEARRLRDRLVEQENLDRKVIIDWSLSVDPVLTPADRPQVVDLYHRLLLARARQGHWILEDDGSWTKRR